MDSTTPRLGFSGTGGLPADPAEASRYHRLLRYIGVADVLLGLALMAVLLAADWTSDIRNFAVRFAGDRHAAALFVYTTILLLLTKLLSLGPDYYSFLIEHRYHLSNQRLRGWAWDQCKEFALTFVFGQALVQMVYLLIRLQPQWWWVTCWILFMLLNVLLAQLAPVLLFPLFFRFRSLADEELTARLTRLSEKAGAKVRGVYEWNLSEKTKKANAALMGLGRTRRIVISDTLLATCNHDEIEAVLAHELGHQVYRHMLKVDCGAGRDYLSRLLVPEAGGPLGCLRLEAPLRPDRLCQPAADDPCCHGDLAAVAAGDERLLAFQRAPGRRLRMEDRWAR